MNREYLKICERAARAGGRVLRDKFGTITAQFKGHKDLVTEADFESQAVIRDILLGAFPDHGFLGEESESTSQTGTDSASKSRYRWIVDPLDGTINYVHGLPSFGVSIALERAGELICGTVLDPIADECFTALSGGGSFLNGHPIHVSDCPRMQDALVGVSFGYQVDPQGPEVRRFIASLMASQAVRRLGAAALNLAYVAAGRLDAYSAGSAKIWDVAAGILLIQEAGGVVTSMQGDIFRLDRPDFASAATPELHAELLDILAQAE